MRIVIALRATISMAVGIFITFNQSHSAAVGLLALAIFGLGFAALNAVGTFVWGKGLTAVENMPLTVAAFIIGLLAILVPANDPSSQALAFIYLVTGWGLISGSFELYLARREGFTSRSGKDSSINAGFGLLLGLLFLVAPLDIVSAVGFFGAYLVLSGVHQAIASATPTK
jgi:uncharacterized membrane protein HdeD (DUF308 family)